MPYDFFVYICDFKSTNSWLCEIVVLMGATISQSFVKIGSKTKNFYFQDIFCKQTADTLFQFSQKPLAQFCSKFQRMFVLGLTSDPFRTSGGHFEIHPKM